MTPRQPLDLTDQQRQELRATLNHHTKPYMRERAGALLKIAAGAAAHAVARQGLLRPREADTVYAWVARYRAEGLAGLLIRKGRGRKPAFSPSARDAN
jgi:hypothetical protein